MKHSDRCEKEEERLRTALGSAWSVEIYNELSSTMDAAKDRCELVNETRPLLVMAKSQASGRGRQGRNWESPQGGFYGTYAFQAEKETSFFTGFSLAVGVAVSRALGGQGCRPSSAIRLKWPNDIMMPDGKKAGGVLIELHRSADRTYVLTGVGLNLSGRALSLEGTASMETVAGKVYSPEDIALLLSAELWSSYLLFLEHGFAPFREEWLKRALFLNDRLSVECGGETIEGIFKGVNDKGALLLSQGETTREIVTGHIAGIYASHN